MSLHPPLPSITFLVIDNADVCYSKVFIDSSFSITRIYGNANILLVMRGEREDDGQQVVSVTGPSLVLGLIRGALPGYFCF